MNILIVNHYAGGPDFGMEYRPFYLANEWIKLGHKVNILAADYSHLRSTQPVVSRDLQIDIIDKIGYVWIKTLIYKSSGIRRIFNILLFVIKTALRFKKISSISNPDVVIASSTYPLDIYPAYLIARNNKAKLVFELHDLWPLSPRIIGNYSRYHPFILILQRAENFACRKCDIYISLLGNTKDYLVQHGLMPQKYHYIPNGYSSIDSDIDYSLLPIEHSLTLSKLRRDKQILIGYVGGHAPSNALSNLISSARLLKNNRRVSFILIGDGTQKLELLRLVEFEGLSNVTFLPPVSKSAIPVILEYFDVLFAGGVSSELHQYGTSFNKITDYMLAAKPIIFAVNDPNSIVEKAECGVRIEADDARLLTKAIEAFSSLSVEERNKIGKRGREYAITNLNYNHLAKRFIEAIGAD